MNIINKLSLFALCTFLSITVSPVRAQTGNGSTTSTKITVKTIHIQSSAGLSEKQLLKVVSQAQGQTLTYEEIVELGTQLTRYCQAHGFPKASTIVPAQNFKNGVVNFQITLSPAANSLPSANKGALAVVPVNIGQTNQNGDSVQQLYARAKWLVSRGRSDLAQDALDKLFSITNNHPAALSLQAQLYLQQDEPAKAQSMIDQLRRNDPDNVDLRRIESLIRSEGKDKGELRRARNLAKEARVLQQKLSQLRNQGREREAAEQLQQRNARYQEAIAIFDKLFPDGFPNDDLALEYWDMVSNLPNGWQNTHDGLSKLANSNPDNMRFRLALAEHELSHPPLVRKNLQIIIDATKIAEHSKQARSVWRRVVLRLSDEPNSLPLLNEYIAAEPDDSGVQVKIDAINQAIAHHQQLMADPNYRLQSEGLELLDKGDLTAAEPLLLQAMEARPTDSEVIGGMGLLRLRQGRHAEAKDYFKQAYQLSTDNKKKWYDLGNVADFWRLMREVREARQAGDFASAKAKANSALRLKRNEPNAYAALGDIETDSGSAETASALYKKALSFDPLNSSALEGLLSLSRRQGMTQAQRFASTLTPAQREVVGQTLSNMEMANLKAQATDSDELLSVLDHIPAERRSNEVWRTWGNEIAQLANSHAEAGRKDEAERVLTEAETLAETNEDANLAIAVAWAKLGNTDHAEKIFAQLKAAKSPTSTRWNLAHADYLTIKHAPELAAELDALRAQTETLLPEEQLRLHDLTTRYYIDTANGFLQSKRYQDGHQTLEKPLTNAPYRVSLLMVKARLFQAEKKYPEASTFYTAILGLNPYDPDGRQGLVESLFANGHDEVALAQLDHWAAHSETENLPNQQQLVDLYLHIDEAERARKLVQSLLAKHPSDPYVIKQAMQVAQHQRQQDDQIAYLRQSISLARGEIPANQDDEDEAATDAAGNTQMGFNRLGSPKKIHRDWQEKKLAALIDRRGNWLSAAADFRNIIGTPGVSQFNIMELPIEFKRRWHPNDEVFIRTDLIRMNAGTLAASNNSFGSMELCQPNCNAALLPQSAQGAGFTAGYINGKLRADVGVTPNNFLVPNYVGGISTRAEIGEQSFDLELSRRPLTGSVLSYAGARDPNSGEIWGGVVASGIRLGTGLGNSEKYSLTATLDAHKLTGKNVASNDRARLMAFYSWYFVNEENQRFALGLSGAYWRHSHNLGEYTFGHGGYFSPLDYRSMGVNLNYGERFPRLSYQVRGGISTSTSITDGAVHFPTRSDLQTQSGLLYTRSSGRGWGYSLQGSVEYQVAQPFFVGGYFAVDRADSYVPNRAGVYLRYSLGQPAAQPVNFPPLPVEPSSQF